MTPQEFNQLCADHVGHDDDEMTRADMVYNERKLNMSKFGKYKDYGN